MENIGRGKVKLSDIRKKMKEIYLDVYFKLKPLEYKKGNKILLTVTDGLGDNIVREKLLRKFLEEYGNDRVIVMCAEKTKTFLEKLGFKNIFIYNSYHRKRVKGKIELIKKIANLGIERIVSLEFNQHDIFIKYLNNLEKVGFFNKNNFECAKYYDKVILNCTLSSTQFNYQHFFFFYSLSFLYSRGLRSPRFFCNLSSL